MKLYEKYRPSSFSQIIAQSKAIAIIEGLQVRGGLSGNCFKAREWGQIQENLDK